MSDVKVHKLVAAYPEGAYNQDGPPPGEFVIPKVTVTGESANQFIGIPSFKLCNIAEVVEVLNGEELDDMASKLKEHFKGLPGEYLETMIIKTTVAATGLKLEERVRVYVDSASANLQLVSDDTQLVTLWENLKPTNVR